MDHAVLDAIIDIFVALVGSLVGLAVWLTKRLVSSYLELVKALRAEVDKLQKQVEKQNERIRALEIDLEYTSRHGGTGP